MKKISDDIKKPWLKATLKDIKNLINNKTFIVEYTEKYEPVTRCMDVYKANIQSSGSVDKLKSGILVRGDIQNKKLVRYTWSPIASMRTLKYFLADETIHKARFHQLYFIGVFLQAKVKKRVFFKLDSSSTDYFLEYSK